MLKHATTILVIGFVLFVLGLFTLFINMVGVDLIFLEWIYAISPVFSFAVRLGMVIVGLIMIFIGSTNWEREEA